MFDTRGPIDYKRFEKVLLRDFRGKIFARARENGNSRLRKLIMPASNGRKVSECALYDEPHGAQLEKTWPQWRHAYRDMFIRLAEQLRQN